MEPPEVIAVCSPEGENFHWSASKISPKYILITLVVRKHPLKKVCVPEAHSPGLAMLIAAGL